MGNLLRNSLIHFFRIPFLILVIWASNIGCSKDPIQKKEFLDTISEIDAPKELRPMIENLQNLLIQNNKPKITNLVIRFSSNKTLDYENTPRGFCLRVAPTPIIYLYEKDWIGKKAKSYDAQELSLLHLIGHCVYNLKHQTQTTTFKDNHKQYQHPVSLMYSNFNWAKFSPSFLEKNQHDYQKKLIVRFVEKEIVAK